jgi:pimeloyl-ACP methyl ester carboxylesterase
MRERFRVGNRVISYLDSSNQGLGPSAPGGRVRAAASGVLVLIHAFPMNADMWEAQITAAPAGWRYLAPDVQGFGQSEPGGPADPATLSLDDYASDVLALLDHVGVERAVVAGLSMGGYAAFALLRLAAARVRGLVLANTKAEADSADARNARSEMLGLLNRAGVAGVADHMLARLFGETTRHSRPEIERRARRIIEANSAEGVRQAIVRLLNRPDSTGLLPAIRCPTLIVASDEDVVTPADQARAMHRLIPGADLAMIHGAGHVSNLERPGDFNHALHRFLTTRFGG